MAARRMKPLKNAKRHTVKLAEIAFRELGLSSMTRADTERLWRVWRGLQWLDDDQAALRRNLDTLLAVWDKNHDGGALAEGLRKLVAITPGKVPG